ncbi:MAG TPA: imidazoleglycerol-phosphate dehydratase HisB [Trueperaceae bacterium]
MARRADVERTTSETRVSVSLDLDAPPASTAPAASTGHGFLDHLLEQLARHGRFALQVAGEGDLHVDVHHLAEDVGITLGQAVGRALGAREGIERYGDAFAPMDETLAHVVIDLSGRPYLAFEPRGFAGDVGGFSAYHLRELLRGFANHAGATVHVRVLAGEETHHVCEAVMKAFARALGAATRVTHSALPSTKGVL